MNETLFTNLFSAASYAVATMGNNFKKGAQKSGQCEQRQEYKNDKNQEKVMQWGLGF